MDMIVKMIAAMHALNMDNKKPTTIVLNSLSTAEGDPVAIHKSGNP